MDQNIQHRLTASGLLLSKSDNEKNEFLYRSTLTSVCHLYEICLTPRPLYDGMIL